MVISDNFGGARLAVTHLLSSGHTRIGFLSDLRGIYTAAERYRGYLDALQQGPASNPTSGSSAATSTPRSRPSRPRMTC
jgi:DNA-binding LacI/PurR family transcriptional regulator